MFICVLRWATKSIIIKTNMTIKVQHFKNSNSEKTWDRPECPEFVKKWKKKNDCSLNATKSVHLEGVNRLQSPVQWSEHTVQLWTSCWSFCFTAGDFSVGRDPQFGNRWDEGNGSKFYLLDEFVNVDTWIGHMEPFIGSVCEFCFWVTIFNVSNRLFIQ